MITLRLTPFYLSFFMHGLAALGAFTLVASKASSNAMTQIEIISTAINPVSYPGTAKSKKARDSSPTHRAPAPPAVSEVATSAPAKGNLESFTNNEAPSNGKESDLVTGTQSETFSPASSPHPYFKKVWKKLYQANQGINYKSDLNSQYKIRIILDKDGRISTSDVQGDVNQISEELRRRLQRMAFLPPIPDDISQSQIVLQYEVTLTSNRL